MPKQTINSRYIGRVGNNIVNKGGIINENHYFNITNSKLNELVDTLVKSFPDDTSIEDKETFNDSIEVIQNQNARKSLVKTALTALKTIKGTTEFAAAVAAIAQFLGL